MLENKKTNKEKILSFFGKGGVDEERVKELSHLKFSRKRKGL